MTRRLIPTTNLAVSPLCLGLAEFGTRVKGDEALALFETFVALGGNFADSAHCYSFWVPGGDGASERELGRCIAALGCREGFVIATKGGHPDGGEGYRRPDCFLAPEVIARDVDDSLERLGVDCIDLYYLHRDDGKAPVGEVLAALNAQVDAGRVRYLGASNWSVRRIAEANEYAEATEVMGFCASQNAWSLATPTRHIGADPTTRYVTEEDARWYAEVGLAVIPYSASATGFFAGKPGAEGSYPGPENLARRERARELARELKATPTQVALAYLMHRESLVIPIVGTLHTDHLREAVGALEISLAPEQVTWLRDG
jgi:1-deoxyxylulose-5-phosphate synthase